MLNARQARRAARMYYLDCVPIDKIAGALGCSRGEIVEVIDDPGRQQQYIDEAQKARKRLRLRAAAAAEAALEKQVEFLAAEQTETELIVAQQRTAGQLLRAGMEDERTDGTVKLIFENGMPKLGMPKGKYPEGGMVEREGTFTPVLCVDGDQ